MPPQVPPPAASPPCAHPQPAVGADAVAAVQARLGMLAGDFSIIWVDECASTNGTLTAAPPADDGRVHVLVANRQTAGRGRRGRAWLSWPGSSLTFSVLWRFMPGAPAPAGLSLVAGLALARALEGLGAQGIQLKWPNDVLVHGEKLAGILVELLPARGRPPAAVIGIGLNLHLPTGISVPGQSGVTDLSRTLEHELPAATIVLAAILTELHGLFRIYASAGFPALRGAWQQRHAFTDLPVCIRGEDSALYGICAGVDEDGALLLRTEAGLQRVLAGDVSLRPGDGAGA